MNARQFVVGAKKLLAKFTNKGTVIEIDSKRRVENQLAARKQRQRANTVQHDPLKTAKPAQPIEPDLDAEIAKAKIDQALDQRIQQLNS